MLENLIVHKLFNWVVGTRTFIISQAKAGKPVAPTFAIFFYQILSIDNHDFFM